MAEPWFVVNPASGGGFGGKLLRRLAERAPGRAVTIVGADLVAIARDAAASGSALVACGGDGTVAALLEAARGCAEPPAVGIVPLGTGNDLARVHGYPSSATSWARVEAILARLPAARPRALDRWILRGPGVDAAWYNYCSWGFDARIAWQFHRIRRRHGRVLRWRFANLACYGAIGLQERGIPLGLTVRAAGAARAVPAWARALVLANIPSYAGGRRLGAIAADDGRCDAFALGGGIAFGLGLSGWRRPLRLASAASLTVRLPRPAFLQLDGEPHAAAAGDYRVVPGGQARVLALDV